MLKSTRRKLFYALVALFLVIGAGIVLYAEGWRFDFATGRAEKVGEIYVRAYPGDAAIMVDGKPVKSDVGFLTRGTLVPDLLPGTYALALQKDGYQPWQEAAVVSTSLVTEFKYAVLVPQNATVVTTATLKNFALTESGAITQTVRGIFIKNQLLDNGTILDTDPRINALLIRRPNGTIIWNDISASSTVNLNNFFAANGLDIRNTVSVQIDPFDQDRVATINTSRLELLSLRSMSITNTELTSAGTIYAPTFAFSPSGIAWPTFLPSANSSQINFYDIGFDIASNGSTTIPGRTASLTWISGQDFAVLQTNGELYRYNTDAQSLTKIADNVTSVAVADDGAMLAALERNSIEIFASDSNAQPNYWRFNLPDISLIKKISWYHDDRHLFVTYPDHVSFLSLSDTALLNFSTIANGTSPAYDSNANALYILAPTSSLIRYDFPN